MAGAHAFAPFWRGSTSRFVVVHEKNGILKHALRIKQSCMGNILEIYECSFFQQESGHKQVKKHDRK